MRIASGTARGRLIKAPKGRELRPTEERVRQALFNILAPWIQGADFLDLFSGTGAVGLEALSRGAGTAYFVDSYGKAVDSALEHAEAFGLQGADGHASEALKALGSLARDGRRFDFIFLDPPYQQGLGEEALSRLGGLDILKAEPHACVIFEHSTKDSAPREAGRLRKGRENRYGNSVLSFYTVPHAD